MKPKTQTMRCLELFAGSGSFGKVAKARGHEVVSLDSDPYSRADIIVDIRDWMYQNPTLGNFDLIWASPPCNTYSTMNYFAHKGDRDPLTAEPLTLRAQLGTDILYRALDIIQYFLQKNPNLLYTIENPRGMMRRDIRIKAIPYMAVTSYNRYDDPLHRYKPTCFWSNFELTLHKVKRPTNPTTIRYMKQSLSYQIPPKLIHSILIQAESLYTVIVKT